MARGSITLSGVPADGQPHPVAIQMKRWCGANAGQPAGELAVELRLRPRRSGGSRRGGLARCPSGAGSEAGLLSRSGSGSSRGGSCGSGSLSYTASLPRENTRRLGRLGCWGGGTVIRSSGGCRLGGVPGQLLNTSVQSDQTLPPPLRHPPRAGRSCAACWLPYSQRVPAPKWPPCDTAAAKPACACT